jgi:DNA-directed RNA polymerase specialized sigma24 family protein
MPPPRRIRVAPLQHEGTFLDDIDDRQLLEGFLAGDRKLTAVFVRLLLDAIRAESLRRWPGLRRHADDVEGRALLLLTRWKAEGKPLAEHTIQSLAALLVNRSAVTERRAQKVVKKVQEAAAPDPEPEAATAEDETVANDLAAKLWELSAGLKASFQSVLRAHDAAQQGGPPIAEALGLEPATARKLLERAREALLARAKANRIELAPWLDEGES